MEDFLVVFLDDFEERRFATCFVLLISDLVNPFRPGSPKATLVEKQGDLGEVYQSRGLGYRRFFGLYGWQFAIALRQREIPCELKVGIDEKETGVVYPLN